MVCIVIIVITYIHTLIINLFTMFARSLISAFNVFCDMYTTGLPPAVTIITFCFHSLSL